MIDRKISLNDRVQTAWLLWPETWKPCEGTREEEAQSGFVYKQTPDYDHRVGLYARMSRDTDTESANNSRARRMSGQLVERGAPRWPIDERVPTSFYLYR